ncbi:hypothetical protein BDV59DRAFT_67572 [Aspergillus ambiguus]|uniref:uncharacterized protein n=1 Tax=Aspergillus ambiguus TaxID=176160 RepID=UPI003CCE21E0
MASFQRKEETLKMIIRNSTIRFICPPCFKSFPRADTLFRHFRDRGDDMHAGLHKGKSEKQSDMEEFLPYYQRSVKTSVASEDIPSAPDCFAVDFIVEQYHSFQHTMASSQRRVETLKRIIQVSSIHFVCPICLKGFSRSDLLYRHFRKQEDNTHAGLAKRTSKKQSEVEEFLICYRQSLNTSVAVEGIPLDSHCFNVDFVVEHYTGIQY